MPKIGCVLNEQLRPLYVERTEDTWFYTAVYEDTSKQPLLESLTGVAFLAKGDEHFEFQRGGSIFIRNHGDNRRKIIDGHLDGRTLCLRWVGKPDMVFVDYLIAKEKEKYTGSWLEEGF